MKNILILLTLVLGLVFTSFIKNKTRLLEKELANLNNEIFFITSDLTEATLDFEYLTTPKNISFLAKDFLDGNFSYYKESQINRSIEKRKNLNNLEKSNKYNVSSENFSKYIIEKDLKFIKSTNIKRLLVDKSISYKQEKESENTLYSKKVQKWAGIQIVKAFFGLPVIPGK